MKKIYFLVLAFFISGCAANVQTSTTQQGPKESVGALSGMVIGGALANDMAGDSRNKSLATVLGAFCWRSYRSKHWCAIRRKRSVIGW